MTIGLPFRIVTCLLLFLSSWGLAACGGPAGPSPSATATLTATAPPTTAPPTLAATATATLAATATAAAASPPPGGPAPAELIGRWKRVVNDGTVVTFTATGFRVTDVLGGGSGSIVVNGNEIDFFNVSACGLRLPKGVGRYEWALQGVTLHFAPLNSDPCPVRHDHFADQDFTKVGG